jgi:hypothetical protein
MINLLIFFVSETHSCVVYSPPRFRCTVVGSTSEKQGKCNRLSRLLKWPSCTTSTVIDFYYSRTVSPLSLSTWCEPFLAAASLFVFLCVSLTFSLVCGLPTYWLYEFPWLTCQQLCFRHVGSDTTRWSYLGRIVCLGELSIGKIYLICRS